MTPSERAEIALFGQTRGFHTGSEERDLYAISKATLVRTIEAAEKDVLSGVAHRAPDHDRIALDAAHKIEALPSDLRQVQRTARIQCIVLDALSAVTSTPSEPAQRAPDYSAWLIEMPEQFGPLYFQLEHDDDWTSDHNKACHFSRKEDAEKAIEYYGWTQMNAVEHMWPTLTSTECGGK